MKLNCKIHLPRRHLILLSSLAPLPLSQPPGPSSRPSQVPCNFPSQISLFTCRPAAWGAGVPPAWPVPPTALGWEVCSEPPSPKMSHHPPRLRPVMGVAVNDGLLLQSQVQTMPAFTIEPQHRGFQSNSEIWVLFEVGVHRTVSKKDGCSCQNRTPTEPCTHGAPSGALLLKTSSTTATFSLGKKKEQKVQNQLGEAKEGTDHMKVFGGRAALSLHYCFLNTPMFPFRAPSDPPPAQEAGELMCSALGFQLGQRGWF